MKIKRFEMVKSLSNIELAKLLGKLEKRQLSTGEMLFEQGDAGDSMYMIESGRIELFSQTDGAMQSLAVLDPGDSLGEMALLTGEHRSATAIAASDALLYRIEQETFDTLIAEHASISAYFIRLLPQRLILTNDRLQTTKESKSQWITQRLERLPEPKLRFLLWCAVIPVVQQHLIDFVFEPSMSAELISAPELKEFLQLDMSSPQTVTWNDGLSGNPVGDG
ncbi:Crp/Fnr family transcriptional regulator [Paenibacillus mendelii]|uniref:Crp/Fnr family transcriptional regulator n=1 Tax=Paenibacillus mendelii TaxID=206163 RepID=A0ABV6J7P8_9BACL|nr:cyclic nucleotide-binding domain-containing protein [Paenibacillus mendelii]MCQ6560457.1 cyclic nucleotide-binding domain-containing protein [Paenibacillus mendelii]